MADYAKIFRARAEASKGRPREVRLDQMHLAFLEFANAKMLVPISKEELRESGDAMNCRWARGPDFPWYYEEVTLDACDAGADPVAALLARCDDFDIVWRPMKREESFKLGELLALMPPVDREMAMKIFGTGYVVGAMYRADAIHLIQDA